MLDLGKACSLKYKADYARSGMIPTQYDLSKKVKRENDFICMTEKFKQKSCEYY